MAHDDDLSPPPRPFRKRKRWIIAAAAVLWLLVAYELSFGPAFYCVRRGWLSAPLVFKVLYPFPLVPDAWGEAIGLWDYNRWWDDLGRQHAGLPPAKR